MSDLPDINRLYFALEADQLVPVTNAEADIALRREFWYMSGETYVYQERFNHDEAWSALLCEYEAEPIPPEVQEAFDAPAE